MRIIGKTDIGKVRKTNQDDFSYGLFGDNSAWAVVCDGMGGANGGSVASSNAVRLVSEQIVSEFKPDLDADGIKSLLLKAVESANGKVNEMSREDASLSGMGTTIVACIVSDGQVYVAHAGDSRAYLLGENGVKQLTKDHSIVQEMVESGKLTPDEAKTHPSKNIITRALGVDENLDIDISETSLNDGDAVLICTDGLTNHIEMENIETVIRQAGYEECAEKLIGIANENGGSDNITVVVIFNSLSGVN